MRERIHTMRVLAGMLAVGLLPGSVFCQGLITSPRYVDARGGDDSKDGTSPETAWKTLQKVNAVTFGPGGAILFKAGESWEGRLEPRGSGGDGNPILIDRYGEGERPALHGNGEPHVLFLFNQEYWEIRNLEITNHEAVPEGATPTRKRAIHVAARDVGAVRHIVLEDLVIHEVNSEMDTFDSRYYGGIFFQIAGTTTPTWFEDIRVQRCHLHDVDRTAISNDSSWWERGVDSRFGDTLENTGTGADRTDRWVPSTGVVVRDNLLEHIGGNGVIIRVADKALVERNRVFYAGEVISGNGMFCFNTDSTLFQFNEVAYTIYNEGDTDARGIDSDFRTKHTIIQYNYLHHNQYGGVVATGGAGGPTSVPRFNVGTVIRYNILADNEDHVVRVSGNLSDMQVYNNVIYTSEAYPEYRIELVVHGAWSGAYPDSVQYHNNIFLSPGAQPVFSLGNSTNNVFSNNLYWGGSTVNPPSDPAKIEADPQLVNPVTADGWEGLEGYRVSASSPAVSAGRAIDGAPGEDFFGNPIPGGAPLDIGVHQAGDAVSTEDEPPRGSTGMMVYPNPAAGRVHITFQSDRADVVSIRVVDLLGRVVASRDALVSAGTARIGLEPAAWDLASGVYQLRLEKEGVPTDATRFIWLGEDR